VERGEEAIERADGTVRVNADVVRIERTEATSIASSSRRTAARNESTPASFYRPCR